MKACRTGNEICLPESSLPRMVVIGAGFAGISLIKKLKNKPVQIVLLDRNNFHQFQPLLYQVATSGIEPDSIVFPLRKLFKGFQNVHFRMANVERIIPESNKVMTDIGRLEYDYLIIACGSNTNFFGLKDVQKYGIGMKSIQEALDTRSLILQHLERAVVTCDEAERDALTNFAVVGGGPAGVETAGAIAEFKKYVLPKDYPELDAKMMSIYLIEAGDKLLKSMSNKAARNALVYLRQIGVDIKLNTVVRSYDGLNIKTDKKAILKARTVIWTAGVTGNIPIGISRENVTRENRILVDEFCRIKGYPNIYAIGDLAAMISERYPAGHPMVAQVAIQQGRLLAKNIILQLQKKSPKAFSYKDKGALATIGKRRAVADLGNFKFSGYFAWLLWSTVHLISISGFRNKLLVGLNWTWSYFTYDKGNRLIIRRYKTAKSKEEDDANIA
jgi:NADH:quinone reductase (non-electrogenic)